MKTPRSITFYNGKWHDSSTPLISATSHSFMYSFSVFDGARAYDNLLPDVDKHCHRVLQSAANLKMKTDVSAQEIISLAIDGVQQFEKNSPLYIRPSLFLGDGGIGAPIKGDQAEFLISVSDLPFPPPGVGLSLCYSSYRRPDPKSAPTTSKASCLYPISFLAINEAKQKGFNNAIMQDLDGNVLELTLANIFYAYRGGVFTPKAADNYLNGLTRQRVIALLASKGIKVIEKQVSVEDLEQADEVFITGNAPKVEFVNRIEEKKFHPGPFFEVAKKAYRDWAETQTLEEYIKKYGRKAT